MSSHASEFLVAHSTSKKTPSFLKALNTVTGFSNLKRESSPLSVLKNVLIVQEGKAYRLIPLLTPPLLWLDNTIFRFVTFAFHDPSFCSSSIQKVTNFMFHEQVNISASAGTVLTSKIPGKCNSPGKYTVDLFFTFFVFKFFIR